MRSVEDARPALAQMDINIKENRDGIETSRLLHDACDIPSIFLTAYGDDTTLNKVRREMPCGYLIKPFNRRELKAVLDIGLHKAKVDAGVRIAHRKMAATIDGVFEGLIMISLAGDIQFMNRAAEALTGRTRESAINRHFIEVVKRAGPVQLSSRGS